MTEENEKYNLKIKKEDLQKISPFLKKHTFTFLLIALFLFNFWLRALVPLNIPITNQWADNTAENYIKQTLTQDLTNQFPNLPPEQITTEVNKKYTQETKNNPEYEKSKKQLQQQFASYFQNNQKIPYLSEIDPYFWLRHSENILTTGHPGDKETNGKQYDTYRLAPKGNYLGPDELHAWITAAFITIGTIFGLTHLSTSYFIPAILTGLTIIPAYLIGKKIENKLTGIIAAFIIITNTAFLYRTTGGFNDTDSYTVLLPLLIIYFYYQAYTSQKNLTSYIYGTLTGFSIGLFGGLWIGWAFALDIILATTGTYFILLILTSKESLKGYLKTTITIILSSAIFIYLFRDLRSVYYGPFSFLWFLKLEDVATTKIWPNVLTTVAEQGDISINQITTTLGQGMILLFAIGIIMLLLQKKYLFFTLTTIWTLATLYGSTKGLRYLQLILPIFAIITAYGTIQIIKNITKLTEQQIKIPKKITTIILITILTLTAIPLTTKAYNTSYQNTPGMNDVWYNGLQKIKEQSQPNAIITSWWDYGHWFKYIAQRRVTFDGTTQDTPQAHWVGKLLLTNDPKETVNILYALNTQYIDDTKLNLTQYQTISKNIQTGNIPLKENPPESYLITSSDMIGKAGVWAHFGAWNFEKAQYAQDILTGKIQDIEIKTKTSQEINTWISPWPNYYTGQGNCDTNTTTITCTNDIQGNTITFTYNFENNNFTSENFGQPNKITLIQNNTFKTITIDDTSPYSISLLPNQKNIITDPQLADSTFNRLYYYDGIGLEQNFQKIYDTTGLDSQRIIIWKTNYD